MSQPTKKAALLPRLSVIMPVYNIVPCLADAVQSVLNQSFKNFELLLIDDGATDGSGLLCDTLSYQDERIKVFHKPNGGQADARNYGLDRAKGQLIGFVDGDDWIESDFYAKLIDQLDAFNAELSACRFVKVTDRSKLRFDSPWETSQVLSPEEALRLMFDKTGMRFSPCDKIYRRELFEGLRYPTGCHYEDKATTYKLIHHCRALVYSPSLKYHYFVRSDSVMRRPLSASNFDIFEINETLIAFIAAHYPNLLTMARISYAEECEALLSRMVFEGYDAPEAKARCETVMNNLGCLTLD